MSPKNPVLGYGFSLEGREAAWRELEAHLPARAGPDCPSGVDLLELAYGLLDEGCAAQLRTHVQGCASCQARLQIQESAVRRARERPTAAPSTMTLAQASARLRAQ